MRLEGVGTAIVFGAAQFIGARSADVPNLYGVPLKEENPHTTIFEEGYGLDTAQTVPCTIPGLEAAYPEEMSNLRNAAQRLALGDGVVTPAGLGTFAGRNVAAACPNGLAGVEAAYGGETQSNPIVPPQQNVPAPLEIAPTSVPSGDGGIDPESPYADSLPIAGYYAAGILGLVAAGIALLRRSEQTEVNGSVPASPKKEQIKHNPWREQETPERTKLQEIEEQGSKRLRPVDTSAHTLGQRNITYGSGPRGGWHPTDGADNPVYYHTEDPIAELESQVKSHISLWQRLQQWGGGSYDHDPRFKSNEQRAIIAKRILGIAKGNRAVAAELHHKTSAGRKTFKQANEYLDQFDD